MPKERSARNIDFSNPLALALFDQSFRQYEEWTEDAYLTDTDQFLDLADQYRNYKWAESHEDPRYRNLYEYESLVITSIIHAACRGVREMLYGPPLRAMLEDGFTLPPDLGGLTCRNLSCIEPTAALSLVHKWISESNSSDERFMLDRHCQSLIEAAFRQLRGPKIWYPDMIQGSKNCVVQHGQELIRKVCTYRFSSLKSVACYNESYNRYCDRIREELLAVLHECLVLPSKERLEGLPNWKFLVESSTDDFLVSARALMESVVRQLVEQARYTCSGDFGYHNKAHNCVITPDPATANMDPSRPSAVAWHDPILLHYKPAYLMASLMKGNSADRANTAATLLEQMRVRVNTILIERANSLGGSGSMLKKADRNQWKSWLTRLANLLFYTQILSDGSTADSSSSVDLSV